MTPPVPPAYPPKNPRSPPHRERCPGRVNGGTRCIAWLKSGQTHCRNHDPARARERADAGRIRRHPGDPGTELGSYEGIARRAARVLEALENGILYEAGALPDSARTSLDRRLYLEPRAATAMLGVLRFMAAMIALRAGGEPKVPDAKDGKAETKPTAFDLERTLGAAG